MTNDHDKTENKKKQQQQQKNATTAGGKTSLRSSIRINFRITVV